MNPLPTILLVGIALLSTRTVIWYGSPIITRDGLNWYYYRNELTNDCPSAPRLTHTGLLFSELQILKFQQINTLQACGFLYPFSHILLPNVFRTFSMQQGSDVHSYNTIIGTRNYIVMYRVNLSLVDSLLNIAYGSINLELASPKIKQAPNLQKVS